MIIVFLTELFSCDPDFSEMRKKSSDKSVSEAILKFCAGEDVPEPLKPTISKLAGKIDNITKTVEDLVNGRIKEGNYKQWRIVAENSGKLAEINPLASTFVAAAAYAAWEGALSDMFYHQPWEGHHPGWHVFPLILGRNAVKAGAMWAPKRLLKNASEFIAASKMAPHDKAIHLILKEYHEVLASIATKYTKCVTNLAWDLKSASNSEQRPNFRGEVAALLWTLGYVPQAHLMKAGKGMTEYSPSLNLMKIIVDQSMKTMAENSLMQYIWLRMKDRPPFDLRNHRELFELINIRFHNKLVHMFDEVMPEPPSRSYADILAGYFSGDEKLDQSALSNLASHAETLVTSDPVAVIQMRSLLNLVAVKNKEQKDNWRYLSDLAVNILEVHNKMGEFQNLGRCLDIPFYYLESGDSSKLDQKMNFVERYRCSSLWYWLMVTRPEYSETESHFSEMLEKEKMLLRELRGARFIRMLPHLPRHYQRYGFNITEAFDSPIPEGSTPKEGLLKFNPFDQNLAKRELKEAIDRLYDLFTNMGKISAEYANTRKESFISVEKFSSLLNKHRG